MFPNRIKRVEREVLRVLVDLLREVKDPRVQDATLTDVTISKDLRTATVFVSTLRPENLDTVIAGLQHASGMLAHRLGAELDLRRIPRLTFAHDPSLAHGAKIDAILAAALAHDAAVAANRPDDEDSDA